jgi:hypothetical protein
MLLISIVFVPICVLQDKPQRDRIISMCLFLGKSPVSDDFVTLFAKFIIIRLAVAEGGLSEVYYSLTTIKSFFIRWLKLQISAE